MFRGILRKYKDAYRIAETKREKRDIVSTAIDEFKARGGRFMQRVALLPSQENTSKPCYEIVDGPAVSLKARQAFRYLLRGVESEDDHNNEQVTQSEPKVLMEQHPPRRRSPTSQPCIMDSSVPQTSSVSSRTNIPSHSQQRLASLASETPMLASLGTSPYGGGANPMSQQELILPVLPSRKEMSDAALASRTEMLLNLMRYAECWATDTNQHSMPSSISDEQLGNLVLFSMGPPRSPFATRVQLCCDCVLENMLRSTTDSLVSIESACFLSETCVG